jgi:hypothetical protein
MVREIWFWRRERGNVLSKCYGLWVGSVREIWFWRREKRDGFVVDF